MKDLNNKEVLWLKWSGMMLLTGSIAFFSRLFLPQSSSGNGIGEILVAAVIYLLCFYVICGVNKKSRSDLIWKLIIAVFVLRVFLIFMNYSIEFLPPKQDAKQNIQMAAYLADSWRNGGFSLVVSMPVELGYVIPLAGINYFFGYNLYLTSMMNLFFSLMGIFFLYKTALVIANEREAMIAAVIYSLMPYLNYMSFAFNREIVVISLMIFLAYQGLAWKESAGVINRVFLMIAFIYLFFLRQESAAVMALFFFIVVVVNLNISKDMLLGAVKVTGLSLIVFFLCCFSFHVLTQEDGILKQEFHISKISPHGFYEKASRHIDFGFAYLSEERPDSWSECLIFYAPVQVLNFLTRPYPWEIFRVNQIFLVFNNLILYSLYILAMFGMMKLILTRPIRSNIIIFLFLFISLLPASLVKGNGFAASRHREQFIFFIYIMAGIGASLFINMIKSSVNKWAE
jgi:hypothetical protein